MVGPAWWRWRERYPEEAERWIAGISERDRCDLLAVVVASVAREGTPEQVREFANRVVDSPELRDSTFGRVIAHLAVVDPDRMRGVWRGRVSDKPVTGWNAREYVEGLRIAAEAFMRRGESAAPELAEIERTLESVDEDQSWVREFRGRLTRVHALIDPGMVNDEAARLLAALESAESGRLSSSDLNPAMMVLGVLGSVDLPAMEALLREHPVIMEQRNALTEIVKVLAPLNPEAALELSERHTEDTERVSLTTAALRAVIDDADPEAVERMLEAWLQLKIDNALARQSPGLYTPDSRHAPWEHARAGAIAQAAGWLVGSNRPELQQIAFDLMRAVTGSPPVIELLRTTSPATLRPAPDDLLEHLLRETGEGRGHQFSQAVRKIGSEMAARDWERGMEALSVLEPGDRVGALLSIRTR
jgi:hypothetical protein